jgi:hypothetical protein
MRGFLRWPPSGIPSFFIVLQLAIVCHDLLGAFMFFQQRGFHRAVTALAVTNLVRSPIEDG